ncbi:hypothetical protein ACIP5U_32945 [Streptomyces sp. NPDC088788]
MATVSRWETVPDGLDDPADRRAWDVREWCAGTGTTESRRSADATVLP